MLRDHLREAKKEEEGSAQICFGRQGEREEERENVLPRTIIPSRVKMSLVWENSDWERQRGQEMKISLVEGFLDFDEILNSPSTNEVEE